MWRVEGEKVRAKAWLRSDIQSSITNITWEKEELRDTTAALSCVAGGAPSAMDTRMTGHCQSVFQELTKAQELLELCLNYVEQLETEVWEEDE